MRLISVGKVRLEGFEKLRFNLAFNYLYFSACLRGLNQVHFNGEMGYKTQIITFTSHSLTKPTPLSLLAHTLRGNIA